MKEIDCFSFPLKMAQSIAFCVSHHRMNNIILPRLSMNCRIVTLASSATYRQLHRPDKQKPAEAGFMKR
ncbi:hypothetical protein CGZ11_20465 [Salmonella enterica]|uniref:Uncharacterized protein n=1 Tax=Salmonella houtenae TaxID=59205 RepID=A0A5Y6M5H4_SALHO|nr:hypothetical protein [Salmonella enterica]EBF8287823.1 hypothetical protein [Salmonella enterica subsp. houtenae]EBP4188963.1 hypothetical protein [Salmonella enterica subsp. enterica]EDS4966925.1 hypothetical protein [Salmonella enterica subsp. enterica serovar O rough]EAW8160648.1 hypothetical protein [Salmonella enterica]